MLLAQEPMNAVTGTELNAVDDDNNNNGDNNNDGSRNFDADVAALSLSLLNSFSRQVLVDDDDNSKASARASAFCGNLRETTAGACGIGCGIGGPLSPLGGGWRRVGWSGEDGGGDDISMLSSLFHCATLAATADLDSVPTDLEFVEDEEPVVPASVMSDPSRRICVVTTAALPWRTGTAVNPLLRALYLVRHQRRERRRREKERSGLSPKRGTGTITTGDGGCVALVIPWLESLEERKRLYGARDAFASGERGMEDQEAWIRNYAETRCGVSKEEVAALRIVFYPAFYLPAFGSIFPKVDICNFIPAELVDAAILEEPEHLNWFRMPRQSSSESESDGSDGDGDAKKGKESASADAQIGGGETKQTIEASVPPLDERIVGLAPRDRAKLGWTQRFRFSVGIVHTNYEEYARQYGVGASLIAAPAIAAVSALTIRAHCHKVVKLSATLPNFAPGKEVTCNVHGVRGEFIDGDGDAGTAEGGDRSERSATDDAGGDGDYAPVYFIGKLVWAKGFDIMLEIQDLYKKENGEYFAIDIYGGGPDEKAIARAFHGRKKSPTKRPLPSSKSPTTPADPAAATGTAIDPNDRRAAATAASVFANPESIKAQTGEAEAIRRTMKMKRQRNDAAAGRDDVVARYLSLGFEVSGGDAAGLNHPASVTYVTETRSGESTNGGGGGADPFDILGDLSGKSVETGVAASHAVYNIADSSIKSILAISFGQLKSPLSGRGKNKDGDKDKPRGDEKGGAGDKIKKHFVFDPPQSRFEWRRHAIPAKFPGVVDHAQIKSRSHKVFLNPSTSEVLCTTTAEALAMGKFAIIPNHPSNLFFLQFANCLSYETLEECAEKAKWAIENEPAPLSEEEHRKFTWEAATERLFSSSVVTVAQAREWAESGMDRTDARIAYWLSESGEKGNMIRSLFKRRGELLSPSTSTSTKGDDATMNKATLACSQNGTES